MTPPVERLKPFDDRDWDAWSGAEPGPNGEEPMAGYSGDAAVIADRDGVHVLFDDGNLMFTYSVPFPMAVLLADALLAPIREPLTADTLQAWGFERLSEDI